VLERWSAAKRLLLVPSEHIDDANRALGALKAERESAAAEEAKAEAQADAGASYIREMRQALADLRDLESRIKGGTPAGVLSVLPRYVDRMTLHVPHRGPAKAAGPALTCPRGR
jgi:hypothetical protein